MADSPPRVALLADNHFHDVYARFQDGSFSGLLGADGRRATMRTMGAQLTSTRLFNEGFFALRAALDDVLARGIRWVVLNGDLTDEGQPVHVRGMVALLEEYRSRGLEFFATFGNHDPVSPLARPDGKPDFLGEGGRPQGIFSPGAHQDPLRQGPPQEGGLPSIVTTELRCWGYEELWDALGAYGVRPQPQYVYWETPYSSYEGRGYSWELANAESDPGRRRCAVGQGFSVPDATYLVEPVAGLWLVGVDANVYLPRPGADPARVDAASFHGSGEAGWNQMVVHKPQVVEWLRRVALRARALGKSMITFSHYPMVEFYRGKSSTIAEIFGPRGLDLPRSPGAETTRALAGLGLGVHFGGHLHINDTGVYRGDEGFLVNVQIPSLAAYVPAYKVASVDGARVEVDTVVVQEVPGFDALFEHYEDELQCLEAAGTSAWDRTILSAQNYRQLVHGHLRELVRLRFLPTNWPPELRRLLELSLAEVVYLVFLETRLTGAEVLGLPDLPRALRVAASALGKGVSEPGEPSSRQGLLEDWEAAKIQGDKVLGTEGGPGDQPAWTLAVDFHRVVSAGELAQEDLVPRRELYHGLGKVLGGASSGDLTLTAALRQRLGPVIEVINADQAPPNRSFIVDLEGQTVTSRAPSGSEEGPQGRWS